MTLTAPGIDGSNKKVEQPTTPPIEAPKSGDVTKVPSHAKHVQAADSIDVQKSAPTLKGMVGTWRNTSGKGSEGLVVEAKAGGLTIKETSDSYPQRYVFDNVNGTPQVSDPWRGTGMAPGGVVVSTTTTVFKDGKLERLDARAETPAFWGGWIPSQLVERHSFEIKDGKLIEETEAKMYHRMFLFFGPFSNETDWNTSNIASPTSRPLQQTIYERVDAS